MFLNDVRSVREFSVSVHSRYCQFQLKLYREESETNLKGILGYTEDDVVSTDFVGDAS